MPVLYRQKISEYHKNYLTRKAEEEGTTVAQIVRYAIQCAANNYNHEISFQAQKAMDESKGKS